MRYLNSYHESRYKVTELEEAESGIVLFFKIIIGSFVLFLVLGLLNELLDNSYPVNGTVVGYSFSEGRYVGPETGIADGVNLLSMLTYYRGDAYEVNARLESGEIVSFLCFSCTETSYTAGDSVSIQVSDRLVGRLKFSENR